MTRKSSSSASTQQRSSAGRKSGASRNRNTSDQSNRQSASGQRRSDQSGDNRSRGREQSQPQQKEQDWSFSQGQRSSGQPYARDERSFGGRDYDQGRERYPEPGGGGQGFASMDPERRRELASRGGRASHGRYSAQEQDDRRFTREIDSYYGRGQGDQGYRPAGDFREHDRRFDDRERFRDEGPYRSSERGSDRDDWRMHPRESDDYAPSYRSFGGDSYRREEGYGDEYRGYGGGYEGSYREGDRYNREADDRYFSGRGPRESEGGFSGSHRQQSSGGRSRPSSGNSRRRD